MLIQIKGQIQKFVPTIFDVVKSDIFQQFGLFLSRYNLSVIFTVWLQFHPDPNKNLDLADHIVGVVVGSNLWAAVGPWQRFALY